MITISNAPAKGSGTPNRMFGSLLPSFWLVGTTKVYSGVGANFTYSHTFVYGYLCHGRDLNPQNEDISNNTAAQGWSYQSLLTTPQTNSFPQIYRIDGCTDPEMIWGPNAIAIGTNPQKSGFYQSEHDMMNNCQVSY